MNILMLVLRLVHVVAGAFWAGGSLTMDFFIGPAIGATAQAGQQFAGHLMTKTRFVTIMTAAATLTILAGLGLYLTDSHWLTSSWMYSSPGYGYIIGGVAGLSGYISGVMFGQLNKKMAMLGGQIKGQPTPDQLAQLQSFQKQIGKVVPIHKISMIVALIFMATSRYFMF